MKNQAKSLLLFYLFFFLAQVAFAVDTAPTPNLDSCESISREISDRRETLSKMEASLKTLLEDGADYIVSLPVLFQIDLTKTTEVVNRIKDLELRSKQDSKLLVAELNKYESCKKEDVQSEVQELAKLQVQVNLKKVEFLKKDEFKRDTLLTNYKIERDKLNNGLSLKLQLSNSRMALESAKSDLENTENESTKLSGDSSEAILNAKSVVDKVLVDLEAEHLSFIENLKSRQENLDDLRSKMQSASGEELVGNAGQLSSRYKQVSNVWESTVDYLLEVFSSASLQSDIELPAIVEFSVESEAHKAQYDSYLNDYKKASLRKKTLLDIKTKLLNDLKVENFKLLQDAGTLRARLLRKCDEINCDRPRGLNSKNIGILLREIRVVPLRFVAGGLSKWVEIKSKFASGLDGWIDLIRQIFILFILILIPFFLNKILSWTSNKLDRIKKDLISKSMLDYRRRTSFAVWISRLNPFVPSVGMIISIGFASSLIRDTDLKELAIFLYYFQVYYIYRTVKLLLTILLEVVFSADSVDTLKQQKLRIKKSATRISRLVFIEFVLLHITEDTVRRALAYQMFSAIIFWVNIIFVLIEANKWNVEISSAFSHRFPKVWARLQTVYKSKLGKLLLPLLFLSIVANDILKFISSYLIRIDFVKRLLSEVLRKRLERAEKESVAYGPPPSDYLSSFDYYLSANDEIYIERDNSVITQAVDAISSWAGNKSSDDLLIIVGNRGMGKTTSIDHVAKKISNQCETKSLRVPAKITSDAQFFDWLSSLLGHKITNINEFKQYDNVLTSKQALLVDDIQNLFLGTIGGFDAYQLFLEVITLKTSNVFWCLTVNSRSWAYLKGVLGVEHFYGKVIYLTQWRDFEIQNMILARHAQTKYKRTFDESIKAYGAGDRIGQQAEGQFFRLLWGQSRGNPRSALMYWISAISSPSEKQVHVGVPVFVGSSTVASMSDDALFLLSAIARHDSLTYNELSQITSIKDHIIRKCLKEAEDKKLIWIDDTGRVRISSRAQYVIDYFLIGKNFLYE